MDQHIKQFVALLFTSGEGITFARLEQALGVTRAVLDDITVRAVPLLSALGLQLAIGPTKISVATSTDVSEVVRTFVGEELKSNLSRTALETITIVLYKGPVSRSAIDYIRGVNSTYALQSLLARGLIERRVNPKDARSYVYTVSEEFLRYLGIMHPSELPAFESLSTAKETEIASALAAAESSQHVSE